ncbi:NAD(P)-dependent oxidoreductase [Mycobacterium sp. RTGN5]|uniref:NAD-dependent epimerase/dehydratase family protein n=1 Tax=Mycobacterium sp. RTGN5 TaxID=3016522 RepID=UPI0029C764C2|nr:NAD(P)-dependent oxidoreductase [Mycobacterium sp. RTGN5]
MKRVAIIGAAGFVGLELARQLRGADHEITAITRENGRFLLRDSGFNIVAPEDISSVGTVDVVVNLAYPTTGAPHYFPARNREILGQIRAVAGPNTRLIHVSTQAVFGYGFERPIVAAPVEMARDYAYIEAKIELENLILSEFQSNSVQIVRLGNIWGPGSPNWTVALVNKTLFGEPVGIEGVDGYCNATDVANAASYLSYLIDRDELRGHQFYHLAEMSSYRWSAWIEQIESALGQKAVRVPSLQRDPLGLKAEAQEAFASLRPGALYRSLAANRITGSSLRTLIRGLGEGRYDRVKKRFTKALPTGYGLTTIERTVLNIMSAQTQFETRVLAQWSPPVDFEQSWSRVESWMSDAGYTISRRQNC